jgi:RNA polymerase sigma-70 factor (ECF subfamily)
MPGVDAREQERRRIASAQAGDEAWRALFDEHYPKLYAFMRRRVGDRETAEDLAAETFVDAFRGLPRFRWRGKPFGAWLFTVARNRLRMHYRGRAPESIELTERHSVANDEALAVTVNDALSRLSAEYREALELR